MAQRPPAKHPAGVFPRVLFGLALFGVLVVTHLWLQKGADFAYGCSGVEALTVTNLAETMREEPGCAAVTSSVYASFLGVSNLVWGLLFYGAVALLRLGHAATGDDRLRLASLGLVSVGFLYTLYLVYLQAAVIQAFCVLCMTSAVTVTLLLILHVMEHLRLRRAPSAAPTPGRAAFALRPFALVAAVFAVVLVADVVLAQQREDPASSADAEAPPDSPDAAEPDEPPVVEVSDPATQCTYDPNIAPLADFDRFADGPYRGSADASVRVVEIFDPNCPHCKMLNGVLEGAIGENEERARFYFQPFPLRDNSFAQVAALYLAEEQGRFFELMDAFFERQNPVLWGMTLDQVVEAGEAAGMDAADLRARMQDEAGLQPLLARVLADRVAAIEALGNEDGISVPKLLINGRVVASTVESYSPDCITYFIEQAAAGETVSQ